MVSSPHEAVPQSSSPTAACAAIGSRGAKRSRTTTPTTCPGFWETYCDAHAYSATARSCARRTYARSAWGTIPSAKEQLLYQPDYVCFASDHLLSVRKDGSARCWVHGCQAQREWQPMTMADHLYATHPIRMICEPSDARRLLISEDTTLLEMSEETQSAYLPPSCLVGTTPAPDVLSSTTSLVRSLWIVDDRDIQALSIESEPGGKERSFVFTDASHRRGAAHALGASGEHTPMSVNTLLHFIGARLRGHDSYAARYSVQGGRPPRHRRAR